MISFYGVSVRAGCEGSRIVRSTIRCGPTISRNHRQMAGIDWTDEQNDAIVERYFSMLADDEAGHPYNKAEQNRRLQTEIGRPRGSIEFKHQNISAVLIGLGESWISGYKPRFNFQESLAEAVARWLMKHPAWLDPLTRHEATPETSTFREDPILWIGPPPTHSNLPPPAELDQMMRVARKFDVAERDARNRALGRAGEARVLAHERTVLTSAGRADLAHRVRWISDLDGDGSGYDIESFETDGGCRLIEVKTTNGWDRTPFHISRNELDAAEANRDAWCLARLWNFARDPRAFELRPPLAAHVALMPTSFQASFW